MILVILEKALELVSSDCCRTDCDGISTLLDGIKVEPCTRTGKCSDAA